MLISPPPLWDRATRKVRPLLNSLERASKHVEYYGLDLSLAFLQADMRSLASEFSCVRCRGLWGTFDDALRWVAESESAKSPRWLLSLGSILGNDFPAPAITHLARWASTMGDANRLLAGMDSTTDRQRIWESYHDPTGLFERFMRGGLEHTNKVLGCEWYRPHEWEIVGVYTAYRAALGAANHNLEPVSSHFAVFFFVRHYRHQENRKEG